MTTPVQAERDEAPMMRDIRAVVREELGTARRLATQPDDAAMSWECLMMVRDQLERSLGREHMSGCPPMFYPEAIHNAIRKHVLIAFDAATNAYMNMQIGKGGLGQPGRPPNSLEIADFTKRVEAGYVATLKVERDKAETSSG